MVLKIIHDKLQKEQYLLDQLIEQNLICWSNLYFFKGNTDWVSEYTICHSKTQQYNPQGTKMTSIETSRKLKKPVYSNFHDKREKRKPKFKFI